MRPAVLSILSFLPLFAAAEVSVAALKNIRSNAIPHSYLVEFDKANAMGGKRSVSPHEEFYKHMDKHGAAYTVRQEYNEHDLYVGTAITVSSEKELVALSKAPGIKAITPITTHPRLHPVSKHIVTGPEDPVVPKDVLSTHVMTGVDKLHEQGKLGEGIIVGIIDTGVDYTHPALGGGYGAGYKIAMGYDFVGDSYNGTNTPMPDDDPLDQCAGHGTHVAGIIGANPDNGFNISGVAPKATLAAYRGFGCTGSIGDDIIIKALLRAYHDGCHVITLSLGGAGAWTESASAIVASRLTRKGKIVTIAAGNDGQDGAWYTSSPGSGMDVIAVGSVDNTIFPSQNATVSTGFGPITYYSALPLNITEPLPIYATSTDTSVADDACSPLPEDTPDLSGYLVIFRRGACNFTQKLANIAAKGGKRSLVYNNLPGLQVVQLGNYTTALISEEDGAYLVNQFKAGHNVTVSFPQSSASYGLPNPVGGLISDFSTYGPNNDLYFKPAIAAPGGNILSTWPVPLGGYAVLSGTSMATPYVAGSAALLLQTLGNTEDTARRARSIFETTAVAVRSNITEDSPVQTLAVQGAGLINVYNAVYYDTVVTPGEILLNDTATFDGKHTIHIKNNGKKVQTYTLSHVPAGTAITMNGIMPVPGPLPLTKQYATIGLSQTTVTVPPGMTGIVTAKFQPPAGVDPKTFPVYSGQIRISTVAGMSLSVSYMGVAADMGDMQIFDDSTTFLNATLPVIVNRAGIPQLGEATYTFEGYDVPSIVYRLAAGTPVVRFDLVDADCKIPDYGGAARKRSGGGLFKRLRWLFAQVNKTHDEDDSSFDDIPVIGTILEIDYASRNGPPVAPSLNASDTSSFTGLSWHGDFVNGDTVENGSYRILGRALRIGGDPTREDNYEAWLSPVIIVNKSS